MQIKAAIVSIRLFQVIPEPTMPEWTAEARDVQELIEVLTTRFGKARLKVEDIRERRPEASAMTMPSNVSFGRSLSQVGRIHFEIKPNLCSSVELLAKELVQYCHANYRHTGDLSTYMSG